MTMFEKDGRESFSMVNEVVELSQATLDVSLFEPPADYREVKDFSSAAMMASASSGSDDANTGGAGSGQSSSNSGIGANARSLAGSQAAPAPAEVGAKKPGVVRLGLAAVETGAVGDNLSASELAAEVRNALAGRLSGSTIEVVRLEAGPSQAEAEARQKGCDFVVYATVSHKKGGGGFGGMLGKVASAAVTGQAATPGGVKAKDELTLEVKVRAPGEAAPAAAKQFKSKARSAGEDIISPAVEQAAAFILAASVRS
jgi:hypothetical protein